MLLMVDIYSYFFSYIILFPLTVRHLICRFLLVLFGWVYSLNSIPSCLIFPCPLSPPSAASLSWIRAFSPEQALYRSLCDMSGINKQAVLCTVDV